MLLSLSIRDVVLIERLTVTFQSGLCVLTGETGAGKSIVLDALGLALGARGDSSLVRHGADQARVTAEFDLPPAHPVFQVLKEQALEAERSLVLRRGLSADGRSRAWINDQPVSIGLLRRVGEELVEVHGQFDTHGLLDPRTHRDVLDAYAGLTTLAGQVAAAWRGWRQVESARAEAAADIARSRAEEEFLRHAVAELDKLDPQPDEERELSERRSSLMHRSKITEAINAAMADLTGERGVERALATAERILTRVAGKAGGQLDGVIAALERAGAEAAEAVEQLQACHRNLDADPQALERTEERLFSLRAMARKHGVAVDDLAVRRTEMAGKLALLEDQGDVLTRLAREADAARSNFLIASARLGEERRAAAGRLDKAVAAELPPLKLERARFSTLIEPQAEAEWGAGGCDRVSFAVATNPGAPPGPLGRIVSGGELARFMLALKVVLARTGSVPTLIFDEVDTGIGGAVAAAVGERLARLGREVQVLVVTHSPQVAGRGGHHLRVQKAEQGERVLTDVVELDAPARREEIARMLSGSAITREARAAAERLLAGV